MKLVQGTARAIAVSALWLFVGGWAGAVQLKENSADIRQDIKIPDMAVDIKRGNETGCITENHEKWEATEGGCSNIEYVRDNAKVVSIAAGEYRMSIGVIESTILTANVRTKDGQPVGAGIPVTWTSSLGSLSSQSSVTNAASQAIVTLATPKGTPKGISTITATAKGGGASTQVVVVNSAKVAGLTASPPSALADGSSFISLLATMTYENGQSVGAGEELIWGTGIGSFTYAEPKTNANGQALAYLVSTVPGTAFASATRDVAKLAAVSFTSPAPVAPIITTVTSDEINLHNGDLRSPWRVYWTSPNQTQDTTIKISFEYPKYCYPQNPAHEGLVYSPTPGSTSWLINGSQTIYKRVVEPAFGIWCPNALKVIVTLCNGGSCASGSTYPKQHWTNDSM
jgi:hypothetical protein